MEPTDSVTMESVAMLRPAYDTVGNIHDCLLEQAVRFMCEAHGHILVCWQSVASYMNEIHT